MHKLHLNTSIDRESEHGRYLVSCARIRGIATGTLVQMLVTTIAQDQLVQAVLDDDSKRKRLQVGDHKFREDA
jgi:hypothetical protein